MTDFVENAAINAMCHSQSSVIGFIEAISIWVEECLLNTLQKAPYALMADECADVSTLEGCCVENGLPVEHFIDILCSSFSS